MSNICIIPARGNSQRIPKKNIKMFHGKPIIAYSIEVAQESGLFDKIVVSTDSMEIIKVAEIYGADTMIRSPSLSVDSVGTQDVAREVLSQSDMFDKVCVVYPCSPMLNEADLLLALAFLDGTCDFVFSVGTHPLHDSGNFYWGHYISFKAELPIFSPMSRMYPLPKERVCDINTPEDWTRAEKMYDELHSNQRGPEMTATEIGERSDDFYKECVRKLKGLHNASS